MSEFKPGDVVRCISSAGTSLVNKGEKYTVHAVKYNEKHNCTYIYFSANDFEGDRGMNVSRFELVKSAENPFKVGDKVMLEGWEKSYEILEVKGDEIKLKSSSGEYHWYSTILNDFEKELTMKLDPSKKYRKVNTHEPVRIICTDRKDPDMPYVGLYEGSIQGYEGVMCLHENDERIEEVPQVDWSKVEVDTLIWLGKTPRYFHSYCKGYDGQEDKVHFWCNGTTSVTNTTGSSWIDADKCSLEKPNA